MAHYGTYVDFQNLVQRYDTSQLLSALAKLSSMHAGFEFNPMWANLSPWAFAAISREAIAHYEDNLGMRVDDASLVELLNGFNLSYDDAKGSRRDSIAAPILHEQVPYQSLLHDVARGVSLMKDTQSHKGSFRSDWSDVFAYDLDLVVQATLVAHAITLANQGFIYPHNLEPSNFEFNTIVNLEVVRDVVDRLSVHIEDAQADYFETNRQFFESEKFGRHSYNPLLSTPFIRVAEGLLAPQPALILRSVTAESIYYAGYKKWGKRFQDQMGYNVESYVNDLFTSTANTTILPERKWRMGKNRVDSIDFFLVTDNIVVLIECKAAMMPLASRAGGDKRDETIKKCIARARDQIIKTNSGLLGMASEFEDIPKDRKFFGLVVTREPFHLCNTQEITNSFSPSPFPIFTASLAEVEQLAALSGELLEEYFDALNNNKELATFDLNESIRDVIGARRQVHPKIVGALERVLPIV